MRSVIIENLLGENRSGTMFDEAGGHPAEHEGVQRLIALTRALLAKIQKMHYYCTTARTSNRRKKPKKYTLTARTLFPMVSPSITKQKAVYL